MDSGAGDNDRRPQTEELVAGILLTWIPEARRLSDVQESLAEQKKAWRQRILDAVTALHTQGIALGGEDSCDEDAERSLVNGYTVLIDAHQEAWIYMANPVFANPVADPVFAEYVADPANANEFYDGRSFDNAVRMDLKAVRKLFPRSEDESTVDARL